MSGSPAPTPSGRRPASGSEQATLAIRARVPLEILVDVIQPFPTFSEAFLYALQDLRAGVPAAP